MKVVVQRVQASSVAVGQHVIGSINKGLNILVGIGKGDSDAEIEWMAQKCLNIRVFPGNEDNRLTQSVQDINGEILVISQFTLYGDCRKGRRPSFDAAALPEEAERLYEHFVHCLRTSGLRIETGQFGASMSVHIENDGPVTLLIEKET